MKSVMKNKKRDEQRMIEMDTDDYKALCYYGNSSREEILREKSKEYDSYKIKKNVEKRLIKEGYITFNKKSKKLHNPDYIVTKKGYRRYLKLNDISQKDWSFINNILLVIFIILSILSFLKSFGWI